MTEYKIYFILYKYESIKDLFLTTCLAHINQLKNLEIKNCPNEMDI